MVRIRRIGIDPIAEKAHELLPIELQDVLQDQADAVYFEKIWPLQSSGHWRFRVSVCHGQYAGFVTNASIETSWRDNAICPPTAPLGRLISALMQCIAEIGAKQQAELESGGYPNAFLLTPELRLSDWA